MNSDPEIVMPTRRGCNASLVSCLFLAVVIAALAVTPAYAQSGEAVEATIPFRFQAGNVHETGGTYTIEDVFPGLLSMRDARGVAVPIGMSIPIALAQDHSFQPKLVFDRYGDKYFLAEIWTSRRGQKLFVSRDEREFIDRQFMESPSGKVAVVAKTQR